MASNSSIIHSVYKVKNERGLIMFKVIIAGTRTFKDYDLLCSYADYMLSQVKEPIEIVSGHAQGADALGERYAQERGYKLTIFAADWNKYGKAAGPRRNLQMAEYANALLAYWDGKSRGTKNMIDIAKDKGLKVGVKVYQ